MQIDLKRAIRFHSHEVYTRMSTIVNMVTAKNFEDFLIDKICEV
jgi:hypothetical protein